jgi:transcription antitermination factor NusG
LEGKDVEADHKEVSDEHKHTGKGFSEIELNAVLQVEDEAVPSTGAERVTADSHVRVGDEVDVVDGVFETCKAAHDTFTGGVGCAISSGLYDSSDYTD